MEKSEKIITPKSLLLVFLFIVVIPLLPLFISWQWDWWEAWAYALINIFGFALSRLLAGRKHPDLIRERSRYLQHPNPEPWDKSLSPILGLWGALMPITAGLDARFDLSADFSLAIKLLSLIVFLLGFVLSSYALIENRFFSGMVRIQTERDHHVINSWSLSLDAAPWLCGCHHQLFDGAILIGFYVDIRPCNPFNHYHSYQNSSGGPNSAKKAGWISGLRQTG